MDQYFKTPEMAGGTRSYEMARRLAARGHHVDLVTSWTGSTRRRAAFDSVEAGVHVHWIPVPYDNAMPFARRIGSFAEFSLRATLQRLPGPFDVVLATSTPLTIAIPGVAAARRHHAPFVFEVRDLWPELPIAIGALRAPPARAAARWLERWAYRNARAVVALSPGMKAGVVAAGTDSDQVAVISNASDLDLFDVPPERGTDFRARRPWLADRPLIVYAGTLGRINGVGVLVDVAVQLQAIAPDVRLLVVGKGAERDAIRADAAARAVLGVNLFMEDAVPKAEVPDLLSAADMAACLFIDLPEMRANSANKFFDALASGTPVLLNYGGWHHDLVRAQGIGVSIWRLEAAEAARVVAERVRDRAWLEQAGRAARATAEAWFARESLADRLERVLAAVVAGDAAALGALAASPAVPVQVDHQPGGGW